MVGGVRRGALVGRLSMGRPASNGDFSGVVKNSFLLRDGEVGPALSETMITGNVAHHAARHRRREPRAAGRRRHADAVAAGGESAVQLNQPLSSRARSEIEWRVFERGASLPPGCGGRGLPAGAHGGSASTRWRFVPASLVLGGRGRSRQYSLRLKAPLRHLPRVSGSNELRSLRSLAAPTPARPSRPTNRSPPAIPCRRGAPLFGVSHCHCGLDRAIKSGA